MKITALISSFLIAARTAAGRYWLPFFVLLFVAGCTVQFQIPPQPVVSNLPDGGKVDVLPDSIPAMYSSRPRFYWEQIERSDSTQSFAVTNGSKDGRWLRGDSMRWHISGPFITVMGDTLKTIVDSTRLTQDSILVYYQNGTIVRRDTISGTGGGGGAGTDDQTLTYNGSGSLTIESGNTVDMSDLLDNTDDQIIDTFSLSGTTLNLSIESDGQPAKTVDLSSLTTNEAITLSGDVTGSGATAITTTIATGAVGADELASTAVTPGSYTHASITVDADGRVTAASSGTDNTGMVTFDVIGDAGTAETVQNADELYLRGQFGVNTSNSATDIINFNIDSSEVATVYALGDTATTLRALINAAGSGSIYILYAEDFYTSDWAVAIQTGIDSLNTLGGGILYIPPGTLELNEQGASALNPGERYCIQLKSGVHLRLHDATILKLANGQQTDANGPVNIIEGENISNASISGGAITGNTAGQTGWTGGYGQTVYGCIIKITAASASAGNTNIYVENTVLYDHFSNPVTIETVGFGFSNRNIRISNIETYNIGEGPSITGAIGAVMENVLVYDSLGVMSGDMTEVVGCKNFVAKNIKTITVAGSSAASAIDIGGSSYGKVIGVQGYNVTNGISISDDSGGNPCKNVIIEDCYFSGIRGGGQYAVIIQDATTDSIYLNDVTAKDMGAGFLIGASGTLSDTSHIWVNNCRAINNAGQGLLYQSGKLAINGGEYSGNQDGFVWSGRQYGNSSEIVINGAAFNNNTRYGINIDNTGTGDSTALPDIKGNVFATGNAGAGGAVNVNIFNNSLTYADTLGYILNSNEKYIATVSNPYVSGLKTLIYNNAANLTTLRGGHHNQVVNVIFDRAVSLIHGSGINTQSGSSDSKSIGDIVTLRYDQPAGIWYEMGYSVGAGSGDNLGNHTATQNINLGTSNWLSGDGDNEGLRVGSTGNVGVGTAPSYKLDVLGTTGDIVRIKGTSTEVRIATNQIYTTNSELNVGSNIAGRALYIKSPTANDIITLNGAGLVGINDNTPSFTLDINATDAVKLPVGTTAQRPTTTNGAIRYNTTRSRFEGVWGGQWRDLAIFEEVSTDRYRCQGATYAFFMSPGELYHTSPTLGIGSNVAGRALYFNSPTANDVITIQGASVGINDNTPDATLDVAGNMRLDGIFYDKDGNAGNAGQILKSTGSAVDWVDRTIVEANTAGSGSPNILTSDESEKVLTNEGSAAQNYHTLPTAAAGLTFTFVVQDADGIRIVANTGDTIRVAGTVSASAGYTESTTVGDVITLVAINATEWIAISYVGTWTTI